MNLPDFPYKREHIIKEKILELRTDTIEKCKPKLILKKEFLGLKEAKFLVHLIENEKWSIIKL